MIKIALSLTIFGDKYETKLFKYVIPSIIKDFKKNNLKIYLFIHYDNELIITKLFDYFSSEKIKFVIYPYFLDKKTVTNFSYEILTKNQKFDFNQSRKQKCEYLIFLYADMFYTPNSIHRCINILTKDKKLKGVCSFGLELNNNKNFKKFYKQLFNIKQKINSYDFFINNFLSIISSFHKNYIIDYGLPSNFNFLISYKIKKTILLKTFDFHPVILRIKNNSNFFNKGPLDSNFIKKNDFNKWYIENDIRKISCFSISDNSLNRNYFRTYKDLKINKSIKKNIFLSNIYFKILRLGGNQNNYYKNYLYLSKSKENIRPEILNKEFNTYILSKGKNGLLLNLKIFLRLIFDFRVLKQMLIIIYSGKKKFMNSNQNLFKNEKLILLKSLTTLFFISIFKK